MRAMVAAVLWVVLFFFTIAIFLDAIVGMKNVLNVSPALSRGLGLYGVILMKNVQLKNFEEI